MLEPLAQPAHHPPHLVPRATRLIAKGDLPGVEAEIWMGGAHSQIGDPFHPQQLHNACVIECAGDLPAHYQPATRLWVPSIFLDVDAPPPRFERLREQAAQVARAARGHDAVESVYSICTHGMNRSGLMAGLVLRELGMPGSDAVDLIMTRRIGSLSNLSFRRLILES